MKRNNLGNDTGTTVAKVLKRDSAATMNNNQQIVDDDDDAPFDVNFSSAYGQDNMFTKGNQGISLIGMIDRTSYDGVAKIRAERRELGQQDSDRVAFGNIIPPLTIRAVTDLNPNWRRFKGIQGHYNSCYLDATLFAMFAFTPIFDYLLSRPKEPNDIPKYDEVQYVLREGIINPMRTRLYVNSENVMTLRHLLDELTSLSGMTSEEQDPEEFLTSLLSQILRADPFLKMNSAESYFYQLFIDKDDRLNLPTVQQLFEQSCLNNGIKFKEIPSRLFIQMPRFGTSYRLYPRIIPSKLLDITDMIENSPRLCSICGELATHECDGCKDSSNSTTDIHDGGLEKNLFCGTCMKTFHRHSQRKKHTPKALSVEKRNNEPQHLQREYLQLFAVMCIETSHYVSFVKCGDDLDAPWCFFDSMSDRIGESDGYNVPAVIACPDMPKWLSVEENLLKKNVPNRELPEHERRLLSDAYICMYQRFKPRDL